MNEHMENSFSLDKYLKREQNENIMKLDTFPRNLNRIILFDEIIMKHLTISRMTSITIFYIFIIIYLNKLHLKFCTETSLDRLKCCRVGIR